jgi:hypothetical protein
VIVLAFGDDCSITEAGETVGAGDSDLCCKSAHKMEANSKM